MKINKNGKEYSIEERKECWVVSHKFEILTVEYKIPKDVCKDKEELCAYIKQQELF